MAELTIPINVNLPDNWLDLVIDRLKENGNLVLVVRCKDCIHWKSNDGQCPVQRTGDSYIDMVPPDNWYCADWAEETTT